MLTLDGQKYFSDVIFAFKTKWWMILTAKRAIEASRNSCVVGNKRWRAEKAGHLENKAAENGRFFSFLGRKLKHLP